MVIGRDSQCFSVSCWRQFVIFCWKGTAYKNIRMLHHIVIVVIIVFTSAIVMLLITVISFLVINLLRTLLSSLSCQIHILSYCHTWNRYLRFMSFLYLRLFRPIILYYHRPAAKINLPSNQPTDQLPQPRQSTCQPTTPTPSQTAMASRELLGRVSLPESWRGTNQPT